MKAAKTFSQLKNGYGLVCKQDNRDGSTKRGYDRRWRKAREVFLKRHPLCECEECVRLGRVRQATVVDHKIPHKGDKNLFWDRNNWQAMAKQCHDRKTAKQDGGFGNESS